MSALGFALLVNPLFPTDPFSSEKMLAPSPLSWTVEREVLRLFRAEERQLSTYVDGQMVPAGDSLPDVYSLASRLARGFIAKTEIVSRAAATTAELDALTEAQQREALLAPWPEMVVKVVPHHAVFLQHLSAAGETTVEGVAEAQPWEGPPATPATAPTGFGKKAAPPAASSPPPSASAAPSGGPNKVLKYAGIGCGVLVGLFLLCLITSAVFGH